MSVMPSAMNPPWTLVAQFLRQHSHDVCNDLNGLDLEAVLLGEYVTETDGTESITRIRSQIRRLATDLRRLAAKFVEPKPVCALYPASELFLIWQEQPAALDPAPTVFWRDESGTAAVNVDASELAQVFRELLENAQTHGTGAPLSATVTVTDRRVVFELHEPKSAPLDPAGWGSQPFGVMRRGHYGLGLWETHRLVQASGGEITRRFVPDPTELITALSFPLG